MPTATEAIVDPQHDAPSEPRARAVSRTLLDALALAGGCALTLTIYGYRFGESNHTIYLLEGLRRARPELLANDWFATQTLQYHALFGLISQKLIEWELLAPAFLAGYAALVLLFHRAWLGLARQLGGGRGSYLLSLALYYGSAAGTGLGMYQFFQDSSFLPSNVANVALLWALYLWMAGRFAASGAGFGLAGLVHLNHAVAGVLAWVALCLWEGYGTRAVNCRPPAAAATRKRFIIVGSVLALAPAMVNILLAANVKLARSGSMPLAEFVELYVRLRHPHHYDPASWPVWLWVAFLWPIAPALMFLRRWPGNAARRAWQIMLLFLALQLVALLGAGVWYINESLVQMSLFRFSIFIQLLACIVVAAGIVLRTAAPRLVASLAIAVCAAMLGACLVRGPFFGAFALPGDDPDYLAVCDWVRENTPVDAVVLVPPGESSLRLRGQRAIVVNFKAVPQLSAELAEWRQRLRTVLALEDLGSLPRGYPRTLRAMDDRYRNLTSDQLLAAARAYRAGLIVTSRPLEPAGGRLTAFASPGGRYFVYDLRRMEDPGDER